MHKRLRIVIPEIKFSPEKNPYNQQGNALDMEISFSK